MAEIRLKNVSKTYKDEEVVKDLNLTIRDGSFTVLVGPSGSGKSTTLRMIAGLEQQSGGEIWIGDRCVNDVAPGKRNIAMVFQNYALYPTMTVRGNIEFGLVNKKVPKKEREQLINEISEIVGLTEYLDKKPQNLSGGQRQRVALARAMVKKPEVFILDEPLSNLDAKLRIQMRTELIQLHKRLGTTFVYVTHDQVEAMSMGDEIVILNKGEIQQMDTPMNVYHDPNNRFTAEFIGTPAMNTFDYEQVKDYFSNLNGDVAFLGFRPEHASLSLTNNTDHSDCLVLHSDIITMETLGSETIYTVKNDIGKMHIKSFIAPFENVKKIIVSVPHEKIYAFDKEGKRNRSVAMGQLNSALLGGV
ncbi:MULTISPECIES: ABC transporter ATP-binding protein [Bacillus]|uniref:ABC transporter ATP-binding protein n=2 Tax=Bacillus TaxID=1386 RepID=A0A0M3RAP7_9BACI|nr:MULTISPECIES: ABC transporter ATP-binding protein [Bacillus]ALC83532.1 ABC transporter ATP-binding protein [Bacillus gobiensis]MBP1082514.1 sn-glycerol 3-phosphate transport system ATP-binding protein [Bacillus capparidis]MED1097252.1 ABC transporter ATP-binding protein [Bacillus capparidis]